MNPKEAPAGMLYLSRRGRAEVRPVGASFRHLEVPHTGRVEHSEFRTNSPTVAPCAMVTSSSSDIGHHHPGDRYRHHSLHRLGPHTPPFSPSSARRLEKEQGTISARSHVAPVVHDRPCNQDQHRRANMPRHHRARNMHRREVEHCSTRHVAEGTPPPWPGEQPDDVPGLVILSNTF
jgi:hypothetical protein